MPYIRDAEREVLDPAINNLIEHIQIANDVDGPTGIAGILNYIITRLLVRTLPKKRYWALALGIGTLVCVIFEFYRRVVAPYEDAAIRTNGDIPEYMEKT